jgi:hypothetical protein
VYIPGERPCFELIITSGSCRECAVAPTYALRSVLENRLAEQHIKKARTPLKVTIEKSNAFSGSKQGHIRVSQTVMYITKVACPLRLYHL